MTVRSGIPLGEGVSDMMGILLAPALLNPTKGYAREAGEIIEGSAQISELGRAKVWVTSHNGLVL